MPFKLAAKSERGAPTSEADEQHAGVVASKLEHAELAGHAAHFVGRKWTP